MRFPSIWLSIVGVRRKSRRTPRMMSKKRVIFLLPLFLSALFLGSVRPAGAKSPNDDWLKIPKTAFRFGEKVEIRVDPTVESPRLYFWNVNDFANVDSRGHQRYATVHIDKVVDRDGSHYFLDTTDKENLQLFQFGKAYHGWDEGGFRFRLLIRVGLRGVDRRTRQRIQTIGYFWLVRPQPLRDNLLTLSTDRIEAGGEFQVKIGNVAALLAENLNFLKSVSVRGTGMKLDLIRLEGMDPGGVLVRDTLWHQYDIPVKSRANNASVATVLTVRIPRVGNYEIRLRGVTGAVIARKKFSVLPKGSGMKLRFEKRTDKNLPKIHFSAHYSGPKDERPAYAFFQVLTFPTGGAPVKEPIDSFFSRVVGVDWAAAGSDRSKIEGVYSSVLGARALSGTHQAWLTYFDPYNTSRTGRSIVLDRVPFDAGDPGARSRTEKQHLLSPNEINISVKQGRSITAGAVLNLTVTPKGKVDISRHPLFVRIIRRYSPGFKCFGTIDIASQALPSFLSRSSYGVASLERHPGVTRLSPNGRIDLELPEFPERWELQVFEAGHLDGRLLANLPIDTVLPYFDDALKFVEPPRIRQPIHFRYAIPRKLPEFSNHFRIEIVNAAVRMGKTLAAPHVIKKHVLYERQGEVGLDGLYSPGPYEARLVADSINSHENFVFSRLQFDIVEPGAIPVPDAYRLERAPEIDDLPASPDDPFRSLKARWPTAEDCAPEAKISEDRPIEISFVRATEIGFVTTKRIFHGAIVRVRAVYRGNHVKCSEQNVQLSGKGYIKKLELENGGAQTERSSENTICFSPPLSVRVQ